MIIRVKHDRDNPYFLLNRCASEDSRLSFKAVGIHTYLMSKPDDWVVQEADLAQRHVDGTASVRAGLTELKDAGYVEVVSVRGDDGKIDRWETHVFEVPTNTKNHNVDFPQSGYSTSWKIDPIVSNDSLVNKESLVTSSSSSGQVFAYYQQNFPGMMTEAIKDELGDLIDGYGVERVLEAMKIAVMAEKRSLRYVNGILRNPGEAVKGSKGREGRLAGQGGGRDEWADPKWAEQAKRDARTISDDELKDIAF